jgi:transcription termination factor NusA
MADALYELGLYSAEEVSNATPEDLIQVRGIGEDTAKKLIAAAQTAVLEARQAEDIEEEKAKEAATGEIDGTEGAQEQTDSEKDTAPPDGALQNDQTDSANGDEPEKAETVIAEAAEQSGDEAETAETDSAEAAEQSEDEAETAETDSAEAAEQSEDKPENAESDKKN